MSYEVKGIIQEVIQEKTTKGDDYTKVVVQEVKDKYPATMAIDFWKDYAAKANDFSAGDSVMIRFNVSSRKSNNEQYYTNLKGYYIAAEF